MMAQLEQMAMEIIQSVGPEGAAMLAEMIMAMLQQGGGAPQGQPVFRKGGKLVRTAGGEAQLMAKEGAYAHVKMPSGEMRMILLDCRATLGQVGNIEHENVSLGKAGRKRHMGVKPTVRGSAMNPVDHPHGGGEGKSPVGRPGPVTPWGKPALGYKTRKKKARTNNMIVRRRNDK